MSKETNKNNRIIIFSDWYDPAYKAGGPIRSCVNFVQNLSSEYEIFVFTSDHDLGDKSSMKNIIPDEWIHHSSGARVMYSSGGLGNIPLLIKIIRSISPKYIYINSAFSPRFTVLPLIILFVLNFKGKIIMSPRGMYKPSALDFKKYKKLIFLQLFKFLGLHKRIHFIASDPLEKIEIEQIFNHTKIDIAQNFPSLNKYNLNSNSKRPGDLKMIFVGRIHPIKNLDFLLNILRRVQHNVSLTIIGPCDDLNYWNTCKSIIDILPTSISVEYLGSIPNQAIDFKEYHLFVSPTQGENFGHAIFEALSNGMPVLISDQTPWRNLAFFCAGWDISLIDDKAFLNAITLAVSWNQEEYRIWCQGARAFALKSLDIESLKIKYRALFN